MTAITAERMARKGDQVQGMAVMGREGIAWSGEFWTTLGEGKLSQFLAQCDRTKIGYIYLSLTDGTTVMADHLTAFRIDR